MILSNIFFLFLTFLTAFQLDQIWHTLGLSKFLFHHHNSLWAHVDGAWAPTGCPGHAGLGKIGCTGPRMTSFQRQWYLSILATWKQVHCQTSRATRRNWLLKRPGVDGCGVTPQVWLSWLCISHLPFPSLDLGFQSPLPTSLTQKGASLSILLGERSSGEVQEALQAPRSWR